MFTYKSIYFLHVHVPVIICKNGIFTWTVYSQSLAYSKLKYFYHAPNLLKKNVQLWNEKKKRMESLRKSKKWTNLSPSMLTYYLTMHIECVIWSSSLTVLWSDSSRGVQSSVQNYSLEAIIWLRGTLSASWILFMTASAALFTSSAKSLQVERNIAIADTVNY